MADWGKPMNKVLIVTTDIYAKIGGGEHVYRTLIASNPDIHFHFFATSKTNIAVMPHNVTPIKLLRKPKIKRDKSIGRYDKVAKSRSIQLNPNELRAAELAEQYAYSAKGQVFDIVDLPEYELVGNYLRSAFRNNNVRFSKLTLFIHGSLSETLRFEGNHAENVINEISEVEKQQRESADSYICLDSWYPNKIEIESELCFQLNPWLFAQYWENDSISTKAPSFSKQSLVFFARGERRKGADLLPLLAKLIIDNRFDISLAGSINLNPFLYNQVDKLAKFRDVTVSSIESTDSKIVFNSIRDTDFLIIPSRFDSFNLVALEGLASGKNLIISNQMGVYHFLKNTHPDLFFIEFDPDDLVISAKTINAFIGEIRQLEERLESNRAIIKNALKSIDSQQYSGFLEQILQLSRSHRFQEPSGIVFSYKANSRLIPLGLKKFVGRVVIARKSFSNPFKLRILIDILAKNRVPRLFALYVEHAFRCFKIAIKFRGSSSIYARPVDFLKLAESEGLPVLRRVTYGVRSLRFAGYETDVIDANHLLIDLHGLGLKEEALALEAIVEDPSGEAVFEYLEKRRIILLSPPQFTFESSTFLESRNKSSKPKISVIVSSFNAATKLSVFLKRLSLCPELSNGIAEVVLVDANSTSPDWEIAHNLADQLGITLRAIRVYRRITIQEAWNFGILSSRGEYLTFLGVDEAIYPSALFKMSNQLDVSPSIDWVMSNSIVTEVGSEGQHLSDVMKYDRDGASLASPFLETCYVSYVGGMYRRNVHEKFGYYDATFKGAGDTEFKSRVLPLLKVKYLNETLGEFLNYPEDRTTATEKIELEDIRAWYIFRTPGGIKYQASLAGDGFYVDLGSNALNYRKSYCRHISTDIEIASATYKAIELSGYNLDDELKKELKFADLQLRLMRRFLGLSTENWKPLSFRDFISLAKWFDVERRNSASTGARRMRLDNMFEQHIWYW